MTNHPLTDEDCYKLCNARGLDHAFDNMRRAADWQLEQAVEFASNYTFLAFSDIEEKALFIQNLKEAMRPTQGEQLQDEAVNKFVEKHSAGWRWLADS